MKVIEVKNGARLGDCIFSVNILNKIVKINDIIIYFGNLPPLLKFYNNNKYKVSYYQDNEKIECVKENFENECTDESKKIKNVLLLTIPKPGFSGQKFDLTALPILEKLNNHRYRSQFEVCVDGGVNDLTVKYLNVESVVSGSYILSAKNPIENIMHLQTSGEYAQY